MPAGNRASVVLDLGEGRNPFLDVSAAAGSGRSKLRAFVALIAMLIGGGMTTRRTSRPRAFCGKARAQATVAISGTTNGAAVTINGVATTATQHNARATITLATVSVADTVTVNGVVFTAVAGSPTGAQFDQSGTDTADAVTLVTAINAHASLTGIITATSALGVVTVRAVTAGTGGNALTLVSSNGARLAVTGSGFLAGGATVAENQWDFGGSDIQTATALAAAINLDTDVLVDDLVEASNLAATFTLATVLEGDYVDVLGRRFTAKALTTTLSFDEFRQNGTDTEDAASLATQINAREGLNQLVFASSSVGVVTVRQIAGTTAIGTLAKSGAAITLSGQLAATATVMVTAYRPGPMGNCITFAASGTGPTASAARLSGGTEAVLTY